IIQEDIGVGYIGGFGIFDLIFLSGLYSLALTIILAYPTSKYPSYRKTIDNKFVSKLIEQTRFSSLTSRLKAYVIDCMLQGMVLGIIFILILTSYNFNINEFLLSFWGFSLFWWAVVFHIAYFTFFEWYYGQTPGKKFTKIQVVNLEPIEKSKHMKKHFNRNELLSVFTRNILRLVDLILFIFVIYRLIVSPKHQRYGDLFAGTGVINK
ncbi:MAG: RDD family protein, partial [Thermoplasmata archaeon]|nr:RDD family protein [Thermoplasmata archaeon]